MTPDQEIGQFDLLPDFKRQLLDENNQAPDLTGQTVLFNVKLPGEHGQNIQSTGTILDARGGYVSHAWQARETKFAGVMQVWALVTAPGGIPVAYPPWGFWTVRVLPIVR